MYRFIFGAGGTGKTTYLYKHLTAEAERHPEKQYYLFVPEQNTLRAQQELIRISSRHGLLNLDVLSFQLLCHRVLEELGEKKPDILDEMSRSLFLRRACQEVKKDLKVYGSKLNAQGFIGQLKSLISECSQYELTEGLFLEAAQHVKSPLLKDKLSDVHLIFEAFYREIGESKAAPVELLSLLQTHMSRSKLLDGAIVAFDGYTGYTPVQLSVIGCIMEHAASCTFAVTIPRGANPFQRERGTEAIADLWWLSKETVAKLCALGEKSGQRHGEDICIDKPETDPQILLVRAEDPTEEVRYAAAHIREMTRRGEAEGLRYRQIAVAVSDPEAYREILRREFDKAGLTYFLDDKSDGTGSAVVELLRAAIGVLSGGWRHEDVVRYLRNPLLLSGSADDMRECIDLIDNYVRAKGLRGARAFSAEWKSGYRGAETLNLAWLNEKKDLLLAPLFHLHEAVLQKKDVWGRVEALTAFMEEIGAAERVSAFCARLSEEGLLRAAEENARFLPLTEELLSRLKTLLGDERLSLTAFEELLDAGFSDLHAGMIPQTMDMLLVGDLKRSRFDGIEVLYIMGANDGLLPAVVSGGGLFTDGERIELQQLSLTLAPADLEDSCIQHFYLYLLMHKPRRRLVISFSKNGRDGRARKPAELVLKLQEENRNLVRIEAGGGRKPGTQEDALSLLAELVREYARAEEPSAERRLRALLHYLRRDERTRARAEEIVRAAYLHHGRDRISEEAARALYGDVLYGSVTRIEQFERCAYAQFLKYGLQLMERRQFEIEAVDIGNLYHSAIDLVFRRLAAQKTTLSNASEDMLSLLVQEAVAEVTEQYNDSIMQTSARSRYLSRRVHSITKSTFWALKQQEKRGVFETYGSELPFRIREGALDMHGRIDRIDTALLPPENGNDDAGNGNENASAARVAVKVIDYKSGRTRFDLSAVYEGVQLQLITYMNLALREVARPGQEAVPAGVFYYHIDDPVLSYDDLSAKAAGGEPAKEQVEKKLLAALKLDGLLNSDPEIYTKMDMALSGENSMFSDVLPLRVTGGKPNANFSQAADQLQWKQLCAHVSKRIRKDAQRILTGEIGAVPAKEQGASQGAACDYCPYHSICGFDSRMPGNVYRQIHSRTKDEIWQALGKEENDA